MQDLRLLFIREALEEYSREVTLAMRRQIGQKKIIETGKLLKSLGYKVYQQAAEGNTNIDFAEWGRFLDMGVGKGQPLSGLKATKAELKAKAGKGGKIRRPRKFYSPTVYGKLNGLIGDLAYGFTEETIARLKEELQNGSTP